jgi:hypothetical protein
MVATLVHEQAVGLDMEGCGMTSLEYKKGGLDARVDCIDLVMKGTKKPVQTATLKALERDRLRIAKLIAGKNQYLRRLVDSYTMASEENKV